MAKKPAKRNITNTTEIKAKVDEGICVLYVGYTADARLVCPECNHSTKRGIVREYKNVLYCSKHCVRRNKHKNSALTGGSQN